MKKKVLPAGLAVARFKIAFFSLFILFSHTLFAQQKAITGKVSDAGNQPVAGASVVVKGSANTGTTSNAEGVYTINVTPGTFLSFSSVGFQSKDVKVGSETSLNITLMPAIGNMDPLLETWMKW